MGACQTIEYIAVYSFRPGTYSERLLLSKKRDRAGTVSSVATNPGQTSKCFQSAGWKPPYEIKQVFRDTFSSSYRLHCPYRRPEYSIQRW